MQGSDYLWCDDVVATKCHFTLHVKVRYISIDLTVDLEKWKFVNGCKDV